MKILYIDTTTADLVVAVVEENSIIDFSLQNCGVKHSETLCCRVSEMLSASNLCWNDFDAYACAVGPGSFTGIRIGIATLKGYNLAVPKPIIAVNSLEAIAFSKKCGCQKSAVINAGNGYYFADYQNSIEPCLISYDDERAQSAGKCSGGIECLDGAASLVRERFLEKQFAEDLVPVYIRRSQAEERR